MSTKNLLRQAVVKGVVLVSIAGLGGCGGGGGSTETETPNTPVAPTAEMMEPGAEYTVQPNDRVVVTSQDPARFSVRHDSATNDRQVILRSGSAELQRSASPTR
ncbi:hypothetical protein [Thioalkalivibrio sp.]|uniref:hypothetical protein n=1 Tax=Thioalkalivibrio sp. TaxID=2093813 RepID=UPI003974B296